MPSQNKYGSLIETLTGSPFINIQLNAKAAPPGDLTLLQADFATSDLYGSIAAGLRLGNFALGDVPRIIGIGVWCNIGDGLVQIDNPDDQVSGLTVQIAGRSYNSANVQQQANIQSPAYGYKVQEFNTVMDVDTLLDMSPLDYTLTGYPVVPQTAGGYFRLTARIASTSALFSTITVDPSFATKRLIMRPVVVVEHTYPFYVTGF